jgi:iron complex outermembrane receptor protein
MLVIATTLSATDARKAAADEEAHDLTSLTLAELANLEVTVVSRRTDASGQAPAAVTVLTPDDLSRAAVTSLADALALVPGVMLGRVDSSGWAVGIRGFTGRLARAQLVLLDGRSVYDPLFAGTYWEVQDTFIEDVARIEVVRGPGGTLWGANAVNGIVSIVTRPASQTQGGLLSLGGGSEELTGAIRYGAGLGEKGAYRVYAKAFSRDATAHEDQSDYDEWHLAQGGFRTDFELAASRRVTVSGDYYRGRLGQRTAISGFTPPYLRDVDQEAPVSGGNLIARAEIGNATIQGYFDRTDRQEARFGEIRDTFDLDFQHRVPALGRHRLIWGLGYRRSAGDSRGSETVALDPPYRADDLETAFIQDELTLTGGKVRVIGGTKLEHNAYTGFEAQPSVRALWGVTPRHSVWAAATRAVRTPSRVEQDIDVWIAASPTVPAFVRWLGNPGFQAEELKSFELGYRGELGGKVSIDLAAFHNLYDGLLGLEPQSLTVDAGRIVGTVTSGNSLEGSSNGAEAALVLRPAPRWLFQGSYSYLSVALTRSPGSESLTTGEDEEGSSPRHQARLRCAVELSRTAEASAALRWVGRIAYGSIPAYAELDLRLAFRPLPALELDLVGRNLLHSRHLEFLGDAPTPSEIERAVFASLRWRF